MCDVLFQLLIEEGRHFYSNVKLNLYIAGSHDAVGSASDSYLLSVVRWNPIIGSACFLEQETLHSLLSTGWF